jgi:uncharacterized sulfatase
VRVTAARALAEFGNASDLELALPALRDHASPQKNGAYVAILALNAIEALGPKAASLHEMLREMPSKDTDAVARVNEYAPKLLKSILGRPDAN